MSVLGRALTHRWALLIVRIGLGTVFIYAGILKMQAPLNFADSIASFQILPAELVNVIAMTLPAFELLVGALLLVGWQKRPASLAVIILTVVFGLALVSALARGIMVDCGCFGSGAPSVAKTWVSLGRDVLMGAGALLLYLRELARDERCVSLVRGDG